MQFCVACGRVILIHEHNLKTANCICLCKFNDRTYCLLIPVFFLAKISLCIIRKIVSGIISFHGSKLGELYILKNGERKIKKFSDTILTLFCV